METLSLDPKTTALVLIDLQRGVVRRPVAPHSASEVVRNAARLADRFRATGSAVFLVRVAFHPDARDILGVPHRREGAVPSAGSDSPSRARRVRVTEGEA